MGRTDLCMGELCSCPHSTIAAVLEEYNKALLIAINAKSPNAWPLTEVTFAAASTQLCRLKYENGTTAPGSVNGPTSYSYDEAGVTAPCERAKRTRNPTVGAIRTLRLPSRLGGGAGVAMVKVVDQVVDLLKKKIVF